MSGIVEAAHEDLLAHHHDVRDRTVVRAAERERARAGRVCQDVCDHATMHDGDDERIAVAFVDAREPAYQARVKRLARFGAGDHIPALLDVQPLIDGVVLVRLDPEQPAFPLAEMHSPRPEVRVPESYQVVVECRDEADQENVFERMRAEGYRCRVLTL